MAFINYLVEGEIDEIIALRIISNSGHDIGVGYGKRGIGYIQNKIQNFNQTAQSVFYLVLVDFMDTKLECPPQVVSRWLPHKNNLMFFRVVVREIESWVLADRENLATFLNVNIELMPINPESELDPKRKLVNIARKSRSKRIRDALVPDQDSTAQVGKLYTSEMKRFVSNFWNIDTARKNSPSLDKCLKRLLEIE